MQKLFIGTSGWHYKHWKERFYPKDLPLKDWFDYFATKFDTVEINNSFYRLPEKKVFVDWRKKSPAKFTFAVKASRFFTHMKKLKVDRVSLNRFMRRIDGLENKLGPILFQLPPKWKMNTERLDEFLSKLPKGYRYTFEFREHSWYHKDVYAVLKKYNAAFCIYELEHHLSPLIATADFVYVRLHGPGNKYQGDYTKSVLNKWARRCKEWIKERKTVYVYFDNDQEAYAAFNALSLKKTCRQ